jgi:hypothetical protein
MAAILFAEVGFSMKNAGELGNYATEEFGFDP